jgi:Amt family ammonium transporter
VAVCAGSDLMHPLGALVVGGVAGALFVLMFTLTQNKWKIDDVLGVWPLHGLCGAWGGIAAGIFGTRRWAGWAACTGAQLIGTLMGVAWAALGGAGLRPAQDHGPAPEPGEEFDGADLSIHTSVPRPSAKPTGEHRCRHRQAAGMSARYA